MIRKCFIIVHGPIQNFFYLSYQPVEETNIELLFIDLKSSHSLHNFVKQEQERFMVQRRIRILGSWILGLGCMWDLNFSSKQSSNHKRKVRLFASIPPLLPHLAPFLGVPRLVFGSESVFFFFFFFKLVSVCIR